MSELDGINYTPREINSIILERTTGKGWRGVIHTIIWALLWGIVFVYVAAEVILLAITGD